METITYGREGAITHEDNLGNKGRTEAGEGRSSVWADDGPYVRPQSRPSEHRP